MQVQTLAAVLLLVALPAAAQLYQHVTQILTGVPCYVSLCNGAYRVTRGPRHTGLPFAVSLQSRGAKFHQGHTGVPSPYCTLNPIVHVGFKRRRSIGVENGRRHQNWATLLSLSLTCNHL